MKFITNYGIDLSYADVEFENSILTNSGIIRKEDAIKIVKANSQLMAENGKDHKCYLPELDEFLNSLFEFENVYPICTPAGWAFDNDNNPYKPIMVKSSMHRSPDKYFKEYQAYFFNSYKRKTLIEKIYSGQIPIYYHLYIYSFHYQINPPNFGGDIFWARGTLAYIR